MFLTHARPPGAAEAVRALVRAWRHARARASVDIVVALVVLVAAVASRGLLLEYTDLLDPTEARYATVAQEMLRSGDWLTPKLPMPEGVVPYLGKPPLHFWLTAVAYQWFSVDEWTARLPSLVAAVAILAAVHVFARRRLGRRAALAASLITMSSVLFFFLAGASVVDVTFSALVSWAVVCFYAFASDPKGSRRVAVLGGLLTGLAVLAKGPAAVVLVGLPLALWSAAARDVSWARRMPWAATAGAGLAVVAPWFLASEWRHPGFLKYYFWNENVARYLVRDYGDRYGSGHVYPYGAAWVMLAVAFCPWAPLLVWRLARAGVRRTFALVRADRDLCFALCWALGAPLFFTFARQLLITYMLPAIPGLAILTARVLLGERSDPTARGSLARAAGVVAAMLAAWGGIAGFASRVGGSPAPAAAVIVAAAGAAALWGASRRPSGLGGVSAVATAGMATYLMVLVSFTPYMDHRRSTEEILKALVRDHGERPEVIRLGFSEKNKYSPYWVAGAWQTELGREVHVEYVAPSSLPASRVGYYLFKAGLEATAPMPPSRDLVFLRQIGPWQLFERNGPVDGIASRRDPAPREAGL